MKVYKKKIHLHALNKLSGIIIDFTVHATDSYTTVLTVLLSLDRLYAIRKPMKIKQFITNLHAKKLMVFSFLILISLKTTSYFFCELHIGGNTHLVYCSLVSPLIFHLIPLITILVLNSWLVKEIICYYTRQKRHSINNLARKSITAMFSFSENQKIRSNSLAAYMRCTRSKKINNTQKSHYIVILISSLWSILTSIPYFTFNPYFSLYQADFFKIDDDISLEKLMMTQMISSILFNSNHFIIFFIYLSFYDEFRNCLIFGFFFKICNQRKNVFQENINHVINLKNSIRSLNMKRKSLIEN